VPDGELVIARRHPVIPSSLDLAAIGDGRPPASRESRPTSAAARPRRALVEFCGRVSRAAADWAERDMKLAELTPMRT